MRCAFIAKMKSFGKHGLQSRDFGKESVKVSRVEPAQVVTLDVLHKLIKRIAKSQDL